MTESLPEDAQQKKPAEQPEDDLPTDGLLRRPVLKAAGAGLVGGALLSGPATAQSVDNRSGKEWAPNFVVFPWGVEVVPDGEQVEPVTEPTVLGYATFQHSYYDSRMAFEVSLANARKVTSVAIHEGPVGENGEQLVELYPKERPANVHGVFLRDTLEREDDRLRNRAEGDADVVAEAMDADNAYLQVELEDGAIRVKLAAICSICSGTNSNELHTHGTHHHAGGKMSDQPDGEPVSRRSKLHGD